MKLLKRILAVVLGLVAILLVVSFFMPSKFSVQRSALIAAEPAALYGRFATPRTWSDWSAWTKREDPTLEYAYEGPESGAGATMKWTSKKMGNGRLTIVDATPGEEVRYELRMDGSDMVVNGHIRFEPAEGGTRVTWHDTGDVGKNPIYRLMTPLMDRMLGSAFEKSFGNLQREAEST